MGHTVLCVQEVVTPFYIVSYYIKWGNYFLDTQNKIGEDFLHIHCAYKYWLAHKFAHIITQSFQYKCA